MGPHPNGTSKLAAAHGLIHERLSRGEFDIIHVAVMQAYLTSIPVHHLTGLGFGAVRSGLVLLCELDGEEVEVTDDALQLLPKGATLIALKVGTSRTRQNLHRLNSVGMQSV